MQVLEGRMAHAQGQVLAKEQLLGEWEGHMREVELENRQLRDELHYTEAGRRKVRAVPRQAFLQCFANCQDPKPTCSPVELSYGQESVSSH